MQVKILVFLSPWDFSQKILYRCPLINIVQVLRFGTKAGGRGCGWGGGGEMQSTPTLINLNRNSHEKGRNVFYSCFFAGYVNLVFSFTF